MPTLSNDVQAVLATDKVRFHGQEVAFVVAEDHYAARDALELIDVDYDILDPVVDVRTALSPDVPVIRTDLEGKTDNHCFDWEAGDAAATDVPSRKPTPSPDRRSSTRACTPHRWKRAARSPITTGSPES